MENQKQASIAGKGQIIAKAEMSTEQINMHLIQRASVICEHVRKSQKGSYKRYYAAYLL
jgi:hypothetical protein